MVIKSIFCQSDMNSYKIFKIVYMSGTNIIIRIFIFILNTLYRTTPITNWQISTFLAFMIIDRVCPI